MPDKSDKVAQDAEDGSHRKESFQKIFDNNVWGSESKSGPGSLLSATVNIRNALNSVIRLMEILMEFYFYFFCIFLVYWIPLVET